MKILILFLFLATAVAFGEVPTALVLDLSYDDDDPSKALDVYLGKSDRPLPVMNYIHGGGWSGGSKNHVPACLLQAVGAGWLSVISVEYRFTNVATHPAQVNDCLRAVQFVRLNAKKWNLAAERIGVIGGARGGISHSAWRFATMRR